MKALSLFSEPYSASGGLAAEGILNQLGRPDMEALEVLVREAVQNSWDAKRSDSQAVTVKVGRVPLVGDAYDDFRTLFTQIPPGLPLIDNMSEGESLLYFSDFGTSGLSGPTRADRPGQPRDFIDFVLNIGQPPDRDLAAGSFGYGKAAFYLASNARTVIVDTLCDNDSGGLDRRLIACGLGSNFESPSRRPFTGRHWWGDLGDGSGPEPLRGEGASYVASCLGLPERNGSADRGTTVAIIAPNVTLSASDQRDQTMDFLAQSLIWNFWPKMVDTPGGVRRSLKCEIYDSGHRVTIPNPRHHPMLRGFVEAIDHLRTGQPNEDDLTVHRIIEKRSPRREELGRLVIVIGPSGASSTPTELQTLGQRTVGNSPHHVALMRTPEIVVKYLPGDVPIAGRASYAGVFLCTPGKDEAFKQGEPPAHDDWIPNSIPDPTDRSIVNVAIRRIRETCREIAGIGVDSHVATTSDMVPLGEFADQLAALLPATDGTGARRSAATTNKPPRLPRRNVLGRQDPAEVTDSWIDVTQVSDGLDSSGATDGFGGNPIHGAVDGTDPILDRADDDGPQTDHEAPTTQLRPKRKPQVKMGEDPRPEVSDDGTPVITYPFQIRGFGNRIRLTASVEIMTNDGRQVEAEVPRGEQLPTVHSWTDPAGREHRDQELTIEADDVDGEWTVHVPLGSDTMMRVDLEMVAL